MPKNDKTIKRKDIEGKKYIPQRFVVTIGIFLLLFLVVAVGFAGIDPKEGLINAGVILIPISPIIIFDVLRGIGLVGQCCVFADDRMYYFKAKTIIKNELEKSANGYVYYSEIKNVAHCHGYKYSYVIIQGNKFEINIEGASQRLVNEIKARAHIDDKRLELYDVKGICYTKYSDVAFYDRNGMVYKICGDLITDKNDKKYDREYCYIDSNGYFYYTEEKMDFYDSLDENFVEYYTDGKEIYVSLRYFVYWDQNQKMYCYDGLFYYELTEFNKK